MQTTKPQDRDQLSAEKIRSLFLSASKTRNKDPREKDVDRVSISTVKGNIYKDSKHAHKVCNILYCSLPIVVSFKQLDLFDSEPIWGTMVFDNRDNTKFITKDVLKSVNTPRVNKNVDLWIDGDKYHKHSQRHCGADITFENKNAKLLAPWDAEISRVDATESETMGYNLVMTPLNKDFYNKLFIHVFHLSNIIPKTGDVVEKGTKLATISNSGWIRDDSGSKRRPGIHAHVSMYYSLVKLSVPFRSVDVATTNLMTINPTFYQIPVHLGVSDFNIATAKFKKDIYSSIYGLSVVRNLQMSYLKGTLFGTKYSTDALPWMYSNIKYAPKWTDIKKKLDVMLLEVRRWNNAHSDFNTDPLFNKTQ